ncbi:MAG: hypothetical protein MRY74_02055 [Neomegalonema sp.]|nr:hypothetical protein [Neomegalonema sp.]
MVCDAVKGFVAAAIATLSVGIGGAQADVTDEAYRPGASYAHFVLASYDADGDGALTQREFDKTGKANFTDIDRDGDGIVSIEEIAAWYIRYLQRD